MNFDAKYRLERFQWEDAAQEGGAEASGQQAYRQDDLNKIHCYRDAILGTRGTYVLYAASRWNHLFLSFAQPIRRDAVFHFLPLGHSHCGRDRPPNAR